MTRSALSRRTFLRGTGVALTLPFLEAMRPAFGAAASAAPPRRMVCIETNMGILPQFFFPQQPGKDYATSPYLERLATHRPQMTVLSGTSLPGVTGDSSKSPSPSEVPVWPVSSIRISALRTYWPVA
ncbi:MAG: DUF1552 domain-containing protein, partial [Verrucomicrobia bacterium]|nr:DUF1552 domain-containing protein [Verrucomicrobiota bacterium]